MLQPDRTDDAGLAERLRIAGNARQALAQIFEENRSRWGEWVEARLGRRLRRRVDAADVLQDAYIRAQGRIESYLDRQSVPVLVWVRGIVAQCFIDAIRHHLRAKIRDARRECRHAPRPPRHRHDSSWVEGPAQPCLPPIHAIIHDERRDLVRAALRSLAVADLQILRLRQFESKSLSEIAVILGIAECAARKRLGRALERFAVALRRAGLRDGAPL